jgi:hypothetical protein
MNWGTDRIIKDLRAENARFRHALRNVMNACQLDREAYDIASRALEYSHDSDDADES